LQRSLELMPPQPNAYGPWLEWRPRPDSGCNHVVPVDMNSVDTIEQAIATVGGRIYHAPMRTPGHHIQFVREVIDDRTEATPGFCQYIVRAGFADRISPYNHLMFQVAGNTDASLLSRYMSALVIAWEPDHLVLASRMTQRVREHRSHQPALGHINFVRAGATFDSGALNGNIEIATVDGGHYIRVRGTPEDPNPDDIRQLREALGYSMDAPTFTFNTTHVIRDKWFALGVESTTGRYFLSIPVSVRIADYEEYYVISEAQYFAFVEDPVSAEPFVDGCRRREHDDLLMIAPPPTNRGTAI
jgi:hypothetical protein